MSQYPGICGLPPDPSFERPFSLGDMPGLNFKDSTDKFRQSALSYGALMKPRFSPPKVLPCAHVIPSKYFACDRPGSKICSGCRLVSYCCKECQQAHWRVHKEACKMELKSDSWKPAWRLEGRPPMFMDEQAATLESLASDPGGSLNGGCALWGNMPATDLVNLSANENDPNKDLSLAFIASGDLRNVMKTINSLPENYSGHLDVLINDLNPLVTGRNVVLLLLLGTLSEEDMAADVALHFWYSTFFPAEYNVKVSTSILPLLHHSSERQANGTGLSSPYPLGSKSALFTPVTGELKLCFEHYISSESISVSAAQAEYNRVRQAPWRCDHRDRMYCQLKPSHRVAFHRFRHHGIVLPFGAPNSHFNSPNPSLFSFAGKWLQTDYADPLEGWNIDEVIQAGKAHGTQPEDIYGCLYFFLADQLRLFTRRIRQLSVSFRVFSLDAKELSEMIQGGQLSAMGLNQKTRFDRIDVSNILDPNYVGLKATLTSWAPFLSRQKHGAIVGYFMNWFLVQKDGRVTGAGEQKMMAVMKTISERLKGTLEGAKANLGKLEAGIFGAIEDADAAYDNSKPFSQFLRKHGLNDVLRTTKLTLRDTHRIVPHRLMVPISAPSNALPEFLDDDSWYNSTKLTHFTWVERYVEFGRS